jgi:hypothetical protein
MHHDYADRFPLEVSTMWLNELRQRWFGRPRNRRQSSPSVRRKPVRPIFELLENRLTPATFNAPDVATLIADINTANSNGVANTINLTAPGGLYVLTGANNTTDGPTGLPVITSPFALTINGNFATIERSYALGQSTPFRLVDVASTGALTLKNVTLENGLEHGIGAWASGGAIFNQGKLTLNAAVVQNNEALGSSGTARVGFAHPGFDAAGGGIWSSGGSLTLTGGTRLDGNYALGGRGGPSGNGGNAFGGGIYANLTKVTVGPGTIVESCFAFGGGGGYRSASVAGSGGSASGGGLYVTGSTTALAAVALTGATLQQDYAIGGQAGAPGSGFGFFGGANGGSASGGGIFASNATLTLSGDTLQYDSALGGGGGNAPRATSQLGRFDHGGNGGDANGGGLYASGGSLSEAISLLVQHNLAQGGYGGAGGNGRYSGGAGGQGGNASGGGLYTNGTAVRMNASPVLQWNTAQGGNGGPGGNASDGLAGAGGGGGGNGGTAAGGALYASASATVSVSLQNAAVQNNQALGGYGAPEGVLANPGSFTSETGGNGGAADGGGLFTNHANLNLSGDTIQYNAALGGGGSSGAFFDGHGGNGGDASGGGLYASNGSVTAANFLLVQNNQAVGGYGMSGGNGDFIGGQGQGGNGGSAFGGGLYTSGATVSLSASPILRYNLAQGGPGAPGGNATNANVTGGNGGSGGDASGGALYATASTAVRVTLNNATVSGNTASGGRGASAGAGVGFWGGIPHGGNGGNSYGGALYLAENATLLSDSIKSNQAGSYYASGGFGSNGAFAGEGGNSAGGALYVASGTITLGSSAIDNNVAYGGHGGNTGHNSPAGRTGQGGTATGGGVAVFGGTVSVKSSFLESNIAQGGFGGAHFNAAETMITGTAGFQGAGGFGLGGGLYVNAGGTLHLTLDDVEFNQADGGFAGLGIGPQSSGVRGGGLDNAGGVFTFDVFSFTHLINNTDSNNDAQNNIGA